MTMITTSIEKLGSQTIHEMSKACQKAVANQQATVLELRLFSIWEITQYMIPVAPAHLRRVLRQHPDLPQGQSEADGTARWFTLDEINKLRQFLAREGSKAKSYLPDRPENAPAPIITIGNAARSSGKTTTTAHLAAAAALEGYRVLLIDLDGQAGLSQRFGCTAKTLEQTMFPVLAQIYARHLQEDNRRRALNAEPPIPLKPFLGRMLQTEIGDLVQSTHWPGLDIIPATLHLQQAELELPNWRLTVRSWKPWLALQECLADHKLRQDYDMIFIDTPPVLGTLTFSAVAAADILLVPLQATEAQITQTGLYLDMLQNQLSAIEDEEMLFAQALGQAGPRFNWNAVYACLSNYHPKAQGQAGAMVQAALGLGLLPHPQEHSRLAEEQTVYDVDYRNFNRETYIQARRSFDGLYGALRQLVHDVWQDHATL